MPVPAELGFALREHHNVPGAHVDLLLAPRADVAFQRLERVDTADLHRFVGAGDGAHARFWLTPFRVSHPGRSVGDARCRLTAPSHVQAIPGIR